jgi:hypothetical protein
MKPFSHQVRRLHLYLALFCLPWFIMYGITSVAFSHPGWFEAPRGLYDTSSGNWTEEGSWPCTVVVPAAGEIPREVTAALVEVAGIQAEAYGAFRSGERQVEVYFPSFWETRRLTYRIEEQRLSLYSRETLPRQVLTEMHARAGFHHDSLLNDAWAVMVDLVCIGFLLWVVTGLYMWWTLPGLRGWGAFGLGAGILSFTLFLFLL